MAVRVSLVEEAAWDSRLIAWKGSGEASHGDALCDDGRRWGARSDTVGGKPPGIECRAANYAPFIHETIFTAPETLTVLQEQSWYAWWESQQGKPYDALEILGYILDLNLMHEGWYVCSAAIISAAASCDLIRPDIWVKPNKVDPVTTGAILSASGWSWKQPA